MNTLPSLLILAINRQLNGADGGASLQCPAHDPTTKGLSRGCRPEIVWCHASSLSVVSTRVRILYCFPTSVTVCRTETSRQPG